MLEKYYKYRIKYKDYIIILKFGNFFECLENDAFIMRELFNYKLNNLSNTFKIGFPLSNIDNVLNKIAEKNINYVVIIDDEVSQTKEFENNCYDNYKYNEHIIHYNLIKVKEITNYLQNNLLSESLINKLEKIEDIIYEG